MVCFPFLCRIFYCGVGALFIYFSVWLFYCLIQFSIFVFWKFFAPCFLFCSFLYFFCKRFWCCCFLLCFYFVFFLIFVIVLIRLYSILGFAFIFSSFVFVFIFIVRIFSFLFLTVFCVVVFVFLFAIFCFCFRNFCLLSLVFHSNLYVFIAFNNLYKSALFFGVSLNQ